MQWIILIGDEKMNLDAIKAIEHYDSVSSHNVHENRYCVSYEADHIFYDYEGDSFEDFEDADLQKIPFSKPHFIMMVYTSEKRMKEVIQQDNFLRNIYIDNDFGLIMPIEEFIKQGMPMGTK